MLKGIFKTERNQVLLIFSLNFLFFYFLKNRDGGSELIPLIEKILYYSLLLSFLMYMFIKILIPKYAILIYFILITSINVYYGYLKFF